MKERDLIIFGGGAGGLIVASVAGQLGLKVTLIEKEDKLGGDCLHYGCVPSKTLIMSAKVASLMRRGAEFGLDSIKPEVDLAKVNAHVKSVVEHIQQHDDPERFRAYGCEILLGQKAEFISRHEVRVGEQVIKAKRFVIATGTRPFIPSIKGLEETGFITNLDLFSLQSLPKRLVVLGGGAIGLEMGQALSRLGSQVTILQRNNQILPQEDSEVANALQDKLIKDGIVIHTGAKTKQVYRESENIYIECENGLKIETDQILVATGRLPNVENMGLEKAGIEYNTKGIIVDRRQRTSQKHIYACGDICGPYQFTHMAEYQAGIVISNAIFRFPKKTNYRVVPWVIYTDPELARVGLTMQQASEQGLNATELRFDFKDVDRALTDVATSGFVKLVTHKGRILGASILGAHAGELLPEIVLAMQAKIKISEISAAIHAYPTLAQIHRRAVNSAYSPKLFSSKTKKIVKWINVLLP